MIRVSELIHTHTQVNICNTQAINSRIEIKTQFTRPGFPRVFKNVWSIYMLTVQAHGGGGDDYDDDEMRPHSYVVCILYIYM